MRVPMMRRAGRKGKSIFSTHPDPFLLPHQSICCVYHTHVGEGGQRGLQHERGWGLGLLCLFSANFSFENGRKIGSQDSWASKRH